MSASATARAGGLAAAGEGRVALWCVDLAAAAPALAEIEERTPRLAEADRARAASFTDRVVEQERLAAYTALRILLELATSAKWRGVPLQRGAHGKPQLPGARIAFSLSHAPGVALIGIAAAEPIGVDVEQARTLRVRAPRRDLIEAAGAALALGEELPEEPEPRALQAWVRIEAFAKARGGGVGRLLTELGIMGAMGVRLATPAAVGERIASLRAEAPAAEVRDVRCGAGLYAAAATAAGVRVPAVQWLPVHVAGIEALLQAGGGGLDVDRGGRAGQKERGGA